MKLLPSAFKKKKKKGAINISWELPGSSVRWRAALAGGSQQSSAGSGVAAEPALPGGGGDTSVTGEPPAWRSEAALPVPAPAFILSPSFLQATGQQPDQLHRRWSLPSPARPGDPVSWLGAGAAGGALPGLRWLWGLEILPAHLRPGV